MATIGAQSFIRLIGPPLMPMIERYETITRPNVDGVAYKERGKGNEAVELESLTECQDAAGVTNAIAAYKALVGTVVTVVDDAGRSITNVFVEEMRPLSQKAFIGAVGGTYTSGVHLRCIWRLRMVATS